MNEKNNVYIKLGIFTLLLVWMGFLMANKIDLSTADLGRHLQNGKWVVENHFHLLDKNSPVHENFYSYTNPDFQVPNHHWGSGVLFYIIYKISGFPGLSIFYILLSLATFFIFFFIAKRESNFTVATMLSLLLLPLIAERREIRPEIFSYFLAAVFLWVLWKWRREELATSRLYALPIIMILWVNLHVYFFLGIFLLGTFWLSDALRMMFSKLSDEEFRGTLSRVKTLTALSFLSVLAAFANPFGWRGLVYPFEIFRNYGYTIVENKSVSFVQNYGIVNPNFILVKIVLAALVVSFALLFFADRKKFSLGNLIFALFFGITGWVAIRNFTALGLFALPVLAANIEGIFTPNEKSNLPAKENGLAMVYIVISILAAFCSWQFVSAHSAESGIGLQPGNLDAADFLKKEKISGPIFNNYDIGGYLIWNLPEKEKVFVDNRPEAYSDSFFSDVYKPMQENSDVFKKIDQQYNFNTVVFSRNDITPWGMNFLKTIKEDPNWAPVFEDNFALIYLKKNETNQSIIENNKQ